MIRAAKICSRVALLLLAGCLLLNAQTTTTTTSSAPITIETSGNISSITPIDGSIVIIRSGAAAGVFVYDKDSSETADGVDTITGPGSVGRLLRLGTADGVVSNAAVTPTANVASMVLLEPADGALIQTKGYTTAGIGSGLYCYRSTGRPSEDNVLYFDGPGADDYFALLHNGVIDVTQAGAVPGGTASTNRAAIQAALDTLNDVFIPVGTFAIDDTVSLAASNQTIFGTGMASRIQTTLNDGTATLLVSSKQFATLRDFVIIGSNATSPYNSTIGLHVLNSQRWRLENVYTGQCSTGIQLENAWIGTGTNVWAKNIGIGMYAIQANDVDMSVHTETAAQPFKFENCKGSRFDLLSEGTNCPTASSYMRNCDAINISHYYQEYVAAPTVPDWEIGDGGSYRCTNIIFDAVYGNWPNAATNVPCFDLDNVDGIRITGRIVTGAGMQSARMTSLTKNADIRLLDVGKTAFQSHISPVPSMGPLVNYWPDPNFERGLPPLLASSNTDPSIDTTVTLPWTDRSMKLTIDGTGTQASAQQQLFLVGELAKLKGKKVGIAAWCKAPADTAYTFTADYDTDVLTLGSHSFTDGTTVRVSTTGTLPTGISANTTYYVRDATGTTIKLAATSGGAAINLIDPGVPNPGTHTIAGGKYYKGAGRCDLYLQSDGTGGTGTTTQNNQFTPGEWTLLCNELQIPSDATYIALNWFANRSSENLTGEAVHFCGTTLWIGGLSAKNDVENGQWTYPQDPLRFSYGTAAPASGPHAVGEVVYNTAPTAGGTIAWVCTTAGTPGTWTPLTFSGSDSVVIATATDADTTPSVDGVDVLILDNTGATTITTFDDGADGQEIEVHVDGSSTLDGTNFRFDSAIGSSFNGGSGGRIIKLRWLDSNSKWNQTAGAVDF